ncbi:MAG: hypothetical protein CTY33_09220 [Methylotenera sp.]|nr:MAG: hypothetical protein CTY33_09220 [Methylotenera sp.]
MVAIIKKIWLYTVIASVSFALFGMALMLIGTFTIEWSCKCNVPNHWQCAGDNCMAESERHFDQFHHNTNCHRTDWPMVILEKTFGTLL